jgi:hypothetical protein
MELGHYHHCRFCGKNVVRLDVSEYLPEGGETVHTACLDVALAVVEGEHVHQFVAKGVRRRGASALSIGVSDTEILWACEQCGAYEVETVPGVWTAAQLGVDETVIEADRKTVPVNLADIAAGAVAMSKAAAREAARGGPGPVEASED